MGQIVGDGVGEVGAKVDEESVSLCKMHMIQITNNASFMKYSYNV